MRRFFIIIIAVIAMLSSFAAPAFATESEYDFSLDQMTETKDGDTVHVRFEEPVVMEKDELYIERCKLEACNQRYFQRFSSVSTMGKARGEDMYRVDGWDFSVKRSEEEAAVRGALVEMKAADITAAAGRFKSRKMQVYFVTAYICDSSSYSNDGAKMRSSLADAGSPYGVLINNKGNCRSYSETFYLCMTMLDIPCELVISDDGSHMWTKVQDEDGVWYHVDVMWCDDPDDFNKYFWKPDADFVGHGVTTD